MKVKELQINNGFQNLHTHTTYCDGKMSVEEMVLGAIEKGGASIGFSEHSYVPFDEEYSMMLEDNQSYVNDVLMCKDKYKDKIDVFLGFELDYFTAASDVPDGLDYILGAVHHVEKEGKFITVDGPAEHLHKMAAKHFGGDYYEMVEFYYATIADIIIKTGADIVGHFDLIANNNDNNSMFDEMHPRYINAAISAMELVLDKCKLFEINTGAMYRRGATTPYPSLYMIKELQKRGGEIILSSDSHDVDSLYYKFDEMLELVRDCGFKSIKRLTSDGFVDVRI